ncbi:hypothetical protein CPB86DRAFT_829135 [Serendipita vermifera]|nr:hypothetical protein CPB86DRAFT_829135 [Serendipita vermifera]
MIPPEYLFRRKTLLIPSIIWVFALYGLSRSRRWWTPRPCTLPEDVSRFYGPGVYWAWILTTISATASAIVHISAQDARKILSNDFMAVCLYALVAMGDVQLRMCATCDINSDLQAQAAIHILWVAFICGLVAFALGQLVYEFKHGIGTDVLDSSREFRAWTAFLLAIIAQLASGSFFQESIVLTIVVDWGVSIVLIEFLLAPPTVTKIVSGSVLYIYPYAVYSEKQSTGSLLWPIFPPKTASNILDMDQVVILTATIVLLSLQWEIWRIVPKVLHQQSRDGASRPQFSKESTFASSI